MATIVEKTVEALKESARHIGKADRAVTNAQIAEVEAAIGLLQNTVDLKKRMNIESDAQS